MKNFDSNTSDEEIVQEIISKSNTLLFEFIYDRYSEKVYNKCISFVKNKDEAQDLTQDIFLKTYIKLRQFKGKSKFSTWLYTLTYNHCVNYVTRDKHSKNASLTTQIADEDANLHIDVDDSILFQLKVDRLKKILEIIPSDDRMILLLKYQDDESIKDISNALDLSESAVKMRIKRAKARVVQINNELEN